MWSREFDHAFVSTEAEIGKDVQISLGTVIHPRTRLGDHCRIGAYCVLGEAPVELGEDSVVGNYCELGHPSAGGDPDEALVIGSGAHIRSFSVFYQGSTIGERLTTGHRVTVREQTRAGNGFQIGTVSDIQGHCTIGNHVRTHSNVHIGQASEIEDYVWIFPYVVLTNDPHPPSEGFLKGPTVRKFAVIATRACIMPDVEIGEDSLVAAGAVVSKDVRPRTVVGGIPAKELCSVEAIVLKDDSGSPAYPWRRHFHRNYPEETIRDWIREFSTDASGKPGPTSEME